MWDFPQRNLARRDRVEPSRGLMDVATLETQTEPFLATFWRRGCETSTRHRNPLFGPFTGVTPANIGLDWLHILCLGIIQQFLMSLVWDCINCNVYNVLGSLSAKHELTINRMRGQLSEWYLAERQIGESHTEVQQLLPALFGTNSARAFRLHAAETNGFLKFTASAMHHWVRLGAKHLHYMRGAAALISIIDAIRDYPMKFPAPAQMRFVEDVCTVFRACETLDLPFTSKHHFLAEMAARYNV